jgi:large subunit ribosomal protein L13
MNKTHIPTSTYTEKKWYIVDAEGKTLGRLASEIATILIGKHKIDYHPAVDIGDYVIVTNASQISVTGNKELQKTYFYHSGRPGSWRKENLKALRNRIPERVIEKAVKGMLPKGPLGRNMFTRLKVFNGTTHPHVAQNPQLLNL